MEITHDTLNETIIAGTLQNGLKYSIIPKKLYSEKRALLTVGAGAVDGAFCTESGSVTRLPLGNAHFLEHELFDNETESAFDIFASLGAYVNAYTSFNNTAYYFSCGSEFARCFDTLLNFVATPCFNTRSVEKERAIIESEIRMYDDNPAWAAYFGMLECVYESHPAKNSIAGDINSVSHITERTLYDCYNAFYVPENINLVCAGGFSPSEIDMILEKASGFMHNRTDKKRAKTYYPQEKQAVNKPFFSRKMNISRPILQIGIKDGGDFKNQVKRRCDVIIALDLLVGESSRLKNSLVKDGIISEPPSFDYVSGDNYGYAMLSAESVYTKRFFELIVQNAEILAKNGVNSDDFNRIKKKHIGKLTRIFNSVDAITLAQAELSHKNARLFDVLDAYERMTIGDCNKVIQELFVQSDENFALSVIEPIEPQGG